MDEQPNSPPKPVDRWLAVGAVVAGVFFYMIPKTPTVVMVLCVICFGLMIHPIWYFWWIERRLWRRISALTLAALAFVWLGMVAWPVAVVRPRIASPPPIRTTIRTDTTDTNKDVAPESTRHVPLRAVASPPFASGIHLSILGITLSPMEPPSGTIIQVEATIRNTADDTAVHDWQLIVDTSPEEHLKAAHTPTKRMNNPLYSGSLEERLDNVKLLRGSEMTGTLTFELAGVDLPAKLVAGFLQDSTMFVLSVRDRKNREDGMRDCIR